MLTIGQLGKRYALSRSTLIYYDRKGLLTPSGRSPSNYRVYSDADIERLERILLFRNAGMPLSTIAGLLDKGSGHTASALEKRLTSINREIHALRTQQKVIIDLIKRQGLIETSRVMTKEKWVATLEAAGLDEEGMKDWHIAFERTSPEAHQDFLESIGIEAEEIASIRCWCRKPG